MFDEELYSYNQKLTEFMEKFLQNREIPADTRKFFIRNRGMALSPPVGTSEQLS